jgi:hypothetical protein
MYSLSIPKYTILSISNQALALEIKIKKRNKSENPQIKSYLVRKRYFSIERIMNKPIRSIEKCRFRTFPH